jgi:hypothetical protein
MKDSLENHEGLREMQRDPWRSGMEDPPELHGAQETLEWKVRKIRGKSMKDSARFKGDIRRSGIAIGKFREIYSRFGGDTGRSMKKQGNLKEIQEDLEWDIQEIEDIGRFGGGTGRSSFLNGKYREENTQRSGWDLLGRFMELRFRGDASCFMKDTGRYRVDTGRFSLDTA